MSSRQLESAARSDAPAARRPWSLAVRLTAWYTSSTFLLLLGATGFLYLALVINLDREDDQLLANKIHILRRVLRDRPEEVGALTQEVEWQEGGQRSMTILVRVLEGGAQAIMETPGMARDLPVDVFPPPAAVDDERGQGIEFEAATGKGYRLMAAHAAMGKSEAPTHVLQLAIDREFDEHLLTGYRRNAALVMGAALIACAGIGYWMARRGLQPLGRMAATATRITTATLNERLALRGLPAEVAALATTFNAMLDRLEQSFQQLDRFSADIAHELRTPVNNLRGEAEVALGRARTPDEYCEVLGSVLEECGRLARLIDSLLFLARAEDPERQLAKEPVDVRRAIEAVCSLYEAAAAEAGVALIVQAPDHLTADLDKGLFQQAVGNLVANGLAHTPRGGRITFDVSCANGTLSLDVQDTGSGISAEHLPHIFDRFYRADPARTRASGRVGLGLALVKRIIELHRGSVGVTSELGRGTCIRATLPIRSVA